MGIPLAIAGVGAATTLASLLMNRKKKYDPDPEGLAMSEFKKVSDPDYMMNQWKQMGQSSVPSFQDFMRMSTAQGVQSPMFATQQYAAANASARESVLQDFRRWQLDKQGQSMGLLDMAFANNRFKLSAEQDRDSWRQSTVAGLGSALMTQGIGMYGMQSTPSTSGFDFTGLNESMSSQNKILEELIRSVQKKKGI